MLLYGYPDDLMVFNDFVQPIIGRLFPVIHLFRLILTFHRNIDKIITEMLSISFLLLLNPADLRQSLFFRTVLHAKIKSRVFH